MAKELAVDPSGLATAAHKLESLVLPPLPPPIAAAGKDSAATAVNTVMPEIEALIIDRLHNIKAALTRTGSNLATAASMYTESDETLGKKISQLGQLVTTPVSQLVSPVGVAELSQLSADAQNIIAGVQGEVGSVSSQLASFTRTPLGQLVVPTAIQGASQLSSVVPGAAQAMQGAIGSASSGGGAIPAQLTNTGTASDQPPGDDAQRGDAATADDAHRADADAQAVTQGAVPNQNMLQDNASQGATGGRPQSDPLEAPAGPPTAGRAPRTPPEVEL
ncbi:hypothetical protein A4G27_08825 [Mycobacterium kansasii]|nr:hypothetical protein A4G27_08825 [Mycobacterium kansasii]